MPVRGRRATHDATAGNAVVNARTTLRSSRLSGLRITDNEDSPQERRNPRTHDDDPGTRARDDVSAEVIPCVWAPDRPMVTVAPGIKVLDRCSPAPRQHSEQPDALLKGASFPPLRHRFSRRRQAWPPRLHPVSRTGHDQTACAARRR